MLNILKLKSFSLFLLIAFSSSIYAEDIRIALRAHQGAEFGMSQWQATADYLSKKIPQHHFVMVPFENISVMNQAISRGDYTFILTNPASAVEYKVRYDFNPIVSLLNKRQGKGYSEFGSVIFTRADRDDINTLNDLRNKSVISVDELAWGGWRIAWKEFLNNNINPYKDFKTMQFAGGAQHNVVYAVRDGKNDAGIVRTDMLERLSADGEIKLQNYKILGQKKSANFPFLHSTDLYPEWSVLSSSDVNLELKEKVTHALLSINMKDVAATKGKYIKWIEPLDYSSVDKVLRKLQVGPYNVSTMGVVERFVNQYGKLFFIVLIVFFLLVLIIIYVLQLNKQILQAKELLRQETESSKKLERQLLHSQRIESLGQLTGGIAHDFNNMLASIIGFTELTLYTETIKEDKKISGYLKHVLAASEKCTALVNQMLTFSRTAADSDRKEDLSVSVFMSKVYKILSPLLPKNHKLILNDIDKKLFIHVNPALIVQALMSLFLNAKDALSKEHGTITISIGKIHFNSSDVFCSSCHQDVRGEYISISIEDDGCGISDEIKEFLFDPFFSTKDVGKGTGMGLSVVHGIVHKHNGHILFDSVIGKGTVVKILLPIAGETKSIEVSPVSLSNTKHINKKIMIVDDEVSLTVYLKELLQQLDFSTVTFNDSEKALQYFLEHSDELALVITDQTMPALTGIEMSTKMLELSDSVPVILCSGYIDGLEEKLLPATNIKTCMEKPIQSDKLIQTIDSLLK